MAGVSAVGVGAVINGVVGDRWIASTLLRWLWKDEDEDRRCLSASVALGRLACPAALLSCPSSGDSSVASSSTTASSSDLGWGSESVKPR